MLIYDNHTLPLWLVHTHSQSRPLRHTMRKDMGSWFFLRNYSPRQSMLSSKAIKVSTISFGSRSSATTIPALCRHAQIALAAFLTAKQTARMRLSKISPLLQRLQAKTKAIPAQRYWLTRIKNQSSKILLLYSFLGFGTVPIGFKKLQFPASIIPRLRSIHAIIKFTTLNCCSLVSSFPRLT